MNQVCALQLPNRSFDVCCSSLLRAMVYWSVFIMIFVCSACAVPSKWVYENFIRIWTIGTSSLQTCMRMYRFPSFVVVLRSIQHCFCFLCFRKSYAYAHLLICLSFVQQIVTVLDMLMKINDDDTFHTLTFQLLGNVINLLSVDSIERFSDGSFAIYVSADEASHPEYVINLRVSDAPKGVYTLTTIPKRLAGGFYSKYNLLVNTEFNQHHRIAKKNFGKWICVLCWHTQLMNLTKIFNKLSTCQKIPWLSDGRTKLLFSQYVVVHQRIWIVC